jgi:hypothetical protein
MRVGDVAAAVAGELAAPHADDVVTAVVTDSRQVTPGALFVAIRGSGSTATTTPPLPRRPARSPSWRSGAACRSPPRSSYRTP